MVNYNDSYTYFEELQWSSSASSILLSWDIWPWGFPKLSRAQNLVRSTPRPPIG